MISLILSLAVSAAHAGWWADFCERHIVAEDPYQYETAPVEWLVREIDAYQIRDAEGKLSNQEKTHLRILRYELARRRDSK